MLDHRQLSKIINKDKLDKVDLILIEDHLDYIGNIKDEYGMDLPIDVDSTLMDDLEKIIERLSIEYNNLRTIRIVNES